MGDAQRGQVCRIDAQLVGDPAALVAFGAVGLLIVFPSQKGPGTGKPVVLDLPVGEGTFALADRLATAYIVWDIVTTRRRG